MKRSRFASTVLIAGGLLTGLAASACSDVEEPGTAAISEPVTVTGCLKAGQAADTIVLAAARTEGSDVSATYQLTGEPAANLWDHLGTRVQVTGLLSGQREIETQEKAGGAEVGATGTAGEAKVTTETEIEIRQLAVASVRPLGEKCEM